MYCTAEVLFSQKQIASRIKERRRAEEKVSGLKKERQKVGLCISNRCAAVDQIHVAEGLKILEIQCAFSVHTRRGTLYQNSGKKRTFTRSGSTHVRS